MKRWALLLLLFLTGILYADFYEIKLKSKGIDSLLIVFSIDRHDKIQKIQIIDEDDPETKWTENFFSAHNSKYWFIYKNKILSGIKSENKKVIENLEINDPLILIKKIAYSIGIQKDLVLFDIIYNNDTGKLMLLFDFSYYSTSAYGEKAGVFKGKQPYTHETLSNGDLHIYDSKHERADMNIIVDKGLLDLIDIDYVEHN